MQRSEVCFHGLPPRAVCKMEINGNQCEESTSTRLGNCEVCGANSAQYTCPRCELKTCSVDCVKIHKKELDCNGERDKTGFVPLSKFSNLNLLSDYRFLEDASRTIENCRRNPLKKYTRFKKQLPPHLKKLKNEARARGTTLQYLPQHFTRHQENTSILHFETKIIYWRLELIFPQADLIKIVVEKCNENERLSAVISQYIDFDKCPDLYKKSLKFYHSTGIPGLEVLLKAENIQTKNSFFLLDMSSTIKENFENRIIIEYPILYVILKSHKDEYNILDPDMEVDTTVDNLRSNPHDFTHFSYFDTVKYKPSKGDEAVDSINKCAAQLRKYFCGEESEEDDEEKKDKEEANVKFHKKKNFKYKKELNIPTYENLIKQNY